MNETTLIRQERERRNFTLDEVCLLAGGKPTVTNLSRAERGFNCLTGRELEAVCQVLGISVEDATVSIRKVADQVRARLSNRTAPVPRRTSRRKSREAEGLNNG